MSSRIFKYTVGAFSIGDAFEAMDLLFEKNHMSVSCVEKNEKWFVEVLSDRYIEESDILIPLKEYSPSLIDIEGIKETNWLRKCFENFKPIIVGEFYIYGPHLRISAMPKDKIGIEIAAATAFGTGEHPSTNRCLLACQTYFDHKKHKNVLDIGCGSCILSIALAKLGAKNVTSCDIDAEAVKISLENIDINRVSHRVNVFQNHSCEFSINKYDFIVSNILSEPLVSISDNIMKSLNNDGILILSGFNSTDSSVLEKYMALGLSIKHTYNLNDWKTIVFQK